jgi:hypothetical protein
MLGAAIVTWLSHPRECMLEVRVGARPGLLDPVDVAGNHVTERCRA